MTIAAALEIALAVLVLGMAAWTIAARETFAAVVGFVAYGLLLALVWSLAPDRVWGGRPGPRHQADPLGVLAFLARLLPPVGIVAGIYVFWVGADLPGGAFQGGTILAAMWLLVMTAGLTDAPPVRLRWLRLVLIAGPAVSSSSASRDGRGR
jgi:multisubunit Na+/H+ antiporter MnhB subunit